MIHEVPQNPRVGVELLDNAKLGQIPASELEIYLTTAVQNRRIQRTAEEQHSAGKGARPHSQPGNRAFMGYQGF